MVWLRLLSCLLTIYSFTMDCLFISFTCFPIGSCVDICLFVQHLFPHFLVTTLIYCGEPIPCGLGEYMTRSGLTESCSSLATVIKEWACNSSQAKENPQQNFKNYWKEGSTDNPQTDDNVSMKLYHVESLRRNSVASRKERELSCDVTFLEALDPAVPKACPTSGL